MQPGPRGMPAIQAAKLAAGHWQLTVSLVTQGTISHHQIVHVLPAMSMDQTPYSPVGTDLATTKREKSIVVTFLDV